jgi:hypothetical protein
MKTLRFFAIIAVILMAVSIATPHVFAQTADAPCTTNFCPLANVDNSKLGDIYSSSGTLSSFLNNIFRFALSIGAILAVLRLGWAGYLYMTSDSWGSKGHAKEVIGDVVLGLLLLLGTWLILYQINPDILKLNVLESLKQIP